MKKLLTLILLSLLSVPLHAQTFDEWFRQKETQKEYLVQQIAALQAYAGTLWQGYTIVRQGISTVHSIKNGDLGLHQDFFSSLRHVNPVVGQTALLTDILTWQAAIHREFDSVPRTGLLSAAELAYLEQAKARVLRHCAQDLEALWLTLTADRLELDDAERLRRIAVIHESIRETFLFTTSFHRETKTLSLLRAQEKKAMQDLQKLYGLSPTP